MQQRKCTEKYTRTLQISYLEIYFSGFKKKQWQLVVVEGVISIERGDKLGERNESIKMVQSI